MFLDLDLTYLKPFLTLSDLDKEKAEEALIKLMNTDRETEFTGWLDLPFDFSLTHEIKDTVKELKKHSQYLLVIGIGGSYLGARSAISFLSPYFKEQNVIFAGFNLDENYLAELLEFLKDKDFSINLISKSGTTTEAAVAFRVFFDLLKEKYGSNLYEHLIITTDNKPSVLREFALSNDIKTFWIPDNVGGRYSVLSVVGLLPICFAGFDIHLLLQGAEEAFKCELAYESNAFNYALARYKLYSKLNKSVEVLISYNEYLRDFNEWWKQLFGESEGKDKKGLFPASCIFSTDLHSLGQFIQEGSEILFETVIDIKEMPNKLLVPHLDSNFDGLDYLENKSIEYINKVASNATSLAHVSGSVPNLKISLLRRDELCLGYLYMFFEISCAISAYLLGVNPFNQPGVEAYKTNMFALLDKPGFLEIKQRLIKNYKKSEI